MKDQETRIKDLSAKIGQTVVIDTARLTENEVDNILLRAERDWSWIPSSETGKALGTTVGYTVATPYQTTMTFDSANTLIQWTSDRFPNARAGIARFIVSHDRSLSIAGYTIRRS